MSKCEPAATARGIIWGRRSGAGPPVFDDPQVRERQALSRDAGREGRDPGTTKTRWRDVIGGLRDVSLLVVV